jgi:hypothetical protein
MRFEASRTRFLIPHFPCPSPSAGEVDKIVLPEGMQSVKFHFCTNLTGTAHMYLMSDGGHIYLIRFGGQPQYVSSFLIFSSFPLFAFTPAGAVDKIVLPEGMQSVNFRNCERITGTAESKDE